MTGPSTTEAKVLLVNMPFASTTIPSLSLALLQANLRAEGHVCDLRHFNLDLVEWFDRALIEAVAYFGYRSGDWLFVPALYGGPIVDDDVAQYLPLVEDLRPYLGGHDLAESLVAMRDRCTEFTQWCADEIAWDDYDVIGFTSMFSQTIPSLALARRIRDRHPSIPLLFGGANFHDEMGVALHQYFDEIDLACLGEGDDVIGPAVEALLGHRDPASVAGIVYRDAEGRSRSTAPAPMTTDLDRLPCPDYGHWLDDRDRVGLGGEPRRLLIETSRGCWWGARSHCTFCGLNPNGMAYRAKSAERTMAEMQHLRRAHRVDIVQACDNILDMRYFTSLLPRLAEVDPPFRLFYDTKATLTHRQVAMLAAAGVTEILPGIESLSDAVLDRMGKGTTALVNIQLLKWCAEFGIDVEWNLIHSFPGDQAEDYEQVLAFVGAIGHLQPPRNMQGVLIDRFSPFQLRPESLGYTNLAAAPVYRLLYPVDAEHLDRIAYEFTADHVDGWQPCDAEAIIGDAVRAWMRGDTQGGGCWMHLDGNEVHISDRRSGTPHASAFSLRGWRAEVYAACDRVRTVDELTSVPGGGGQEPTSSDVMRFLRWCCDRKLLVADGDRYLGTAVHTPARPVAETARRTVLTLRAETRPSALDGEPPGRRLP